jgi:peptide-methionine (S)-S-oxide reductase
MGCFRGAARLLWQLPSAYTTVVGSSGGHTPNPTYEETCTSMTGHTEAVLVVFDPEQVSLDDLPAAFWENHDPTQDVGQGNDIASQHRSAIYTDSDEQLAATEASRDRYQANLDKAGDGTITTEVAPADQFFCAEDYAQQYPAANPRGYSIHGFCEPPTRDPPDSS